MGSDAALLELVSSANIACGGHAGDEQTMAACVRQANAQSVAIGAHPGYCDRDNFGRLPQSLSAAALTKLIHEQVTRLQRICQQEQARLRHVRAHGALGNLIDADTTAAQTLASTIADRFPTLAVMTLGGSFAEHEAKAKNLPVVRQFFADRAYDNDGQLVSRKLEGSVLHDGPLILKRLLAVLDSGKLLSLQGKTIRVTFDSVCVHGDTPGALILAESIRKQLENNGVAIRPYHSSVISDQSLEGRSG